LLFKYLGRKLIKSDNIFVCFEEISSGRKIEKPGLEWEICLRIECSGFIFIRVRRGKPELFAIQKQRQIVQTTISGELFLQNILRFQLWIIILKLKVTIRNLASRKRFLKLRTKKTFICVSYDIPIKHKTKQEFLHQSINRVCKTNNKNVKNRFCPDNA